MRTGGDIWHLITGEYPPETGGVGDYTARVAAGLARSGAEVHVWTSPAPGDAASVPGVTVHREGGRWSRSDLSRLDARLDAFASPRRLLVQYVPNVWNQKGMNIGFCRWLLRRRHQGDSVRVMFHEVRYHPIAGDRPIRWVLVAVQTWMARVLLRAATQVYVSVPAWADLLRQISPRSTTPIAWSPIASNIEPISDPEGVARIRQTLAPEGSLIVGTFGTFGESTATVLAEFFPALLRSDPRCVGLMIGRGGDEFRQRLIAGDPSLNGRVVATGGLDAADVSRHLQACDLLVQADTGGLSTKQSSTMSCLAHGRAIVSAAGRLTESVWTDHRCVALAESPSPTDLLRVAREVLADPARRDQLEKSALTAHDHLFSTMRTIELLTREHETP
jgi:glycosyltransferase involved in cell wall biosynthesis